MKSVMSHQMRANWLVDHFSNLLPAINFTLIVRSHKIWIKSCLALENQNNFDSTHR